MNYIYTLSDPETNEVRYVGKTQNIKERYNKHLRMSKSKKNSNTYLYSWIKSLKSNPKIEVLDEVGNNWQFWEQYWICQFKTWGFNLTNLTIGGEGGKDFFTEKTIEKLRELNTGEKNPHYGKKHSKETIEKIKSANIGRIVSEETRKKISESKMGHSVTDEMREKFRLNNINGITGMKGKKHTEETKIKMSKSSIGKKKSNEHTKKIIKRLKIKILCIENNITYNSIDDAANDLNLRRDCISSCLTNKIPSYKNYHFNYINQIKTINKICICCGKEYATQRKSSKYCSNKCSKVYRSKNSKNSR